MAIARDSQAAQAGLRPGQFLREIAGINFSMQALEDASKGSEPYNVKAKDLIFCHIHEFGGHLEEPISVNRHVTYYTELDEKGKVKAGRWAFVESLPFVPEGEDMRDHLLRYVADSQFAQHVLRNLTEDGYVVLEDVFTAEECERELARMWDWVEAVSPTVKRDDPETHFGAKAAPDPWPFKQRDMMQLFGAGWVFGELREQFAERVSEGIYGTKELHSSKDGFTFQRPTMSTSKEVARRTPNDHFDQGLHMKGLQCVQGSVALTDQEHDDGCFLVWPGSHRHREHILGLKPSTRAREDFIIISDEDKEFLESQGIFERRVPVKKGTVILWRSDVAHKGAPPLGKRDTYRAVVYICCLPAALTPAEVYEQKHRAFEELQSGSHWPNREEWFEIGDRPRKIFDDFRPFAPSPLTQRQKQLYGLTRY